MYICVGHHSKLRRIVWTRETIWVEIKKCFFRCVTDLFIASISAISIILLINVFIVHKSEVFFVNVGVVTVISMKNGSNDNVQSSSLFCSTGVKYIVSSLWKYNGFIEFSFEKSMNFHTRFFKIVEKLNSFVQNITKLDERLYLFLRKKETSFGTGILKFLFKYYFFTDFHNLLLLGIWNRTISTRFENYFARFFSFVIFDKNRLLIIQLRYRVIDNTS